MKMLRIRFIHPSLLRQIHPLILISVILQLILSHFLIVMPSSSIKHNFCSNFISFHPHTLFQPPSPFL